MPLQVGQLPPGQLAAAFALLAAGAAASGPPLEPGLLQRLAAVVRQQVHVYKPPVLTSILVSLAALDRLAGGRRSSSAAAKRGPVSTAGGSMMDESGGNYDGSGDAEAASGGAASSDGVYDIARDTDSNASSGTPSSSTSAVPKELLDELSRWVRRKLINFSTHELLACLTAFAGADYADVYARRFSQSHVWPLHR